MLTLPHHHQSFAPKSTSQSDLWKFGGFKRSATSCKVFLMLLIGHSNPLSRLGGLAVAG
jgi:hypothetical protein